MVVLFRELSVCFAAGIVGGLANSIFLWGAGYFGLSASMGVNIAPVWSPPWLYQRLVWGGIWGMLFLLPLFRRSILLRGILFGIAPSLVQLLWVFPMMLDKGMFGLSLGAMTPVYVLIANSVWGVTAAWWESINHDRPKFRRRY